MYTSTVSGLGDDAAPAAAADGGIMNSITNFLNVAANTGANVYSKVQQLTMAQQQANIQQAQAQQMAQLQQWQFAQKLQSGSSGWLMPVMLGGGALALFFFLRK